VKFKYEKLGIFCFVCGIMGHAENKCPVRFEMEEDNGAREWSSELRADNRRQGGKITSRWLREEKGNREGTGSSNSAAPTESPVVNLNTGPARADVSSTVTPAQANLSNTHHSAIITRQEHLLANNTTSIPMPTQALTSINVPVTDFQIHQSFQSLLARFSNDPTQAMIAADNLKHSAPHSNIPPDTNINSPIIITQPETEIHHTKSLPNQTFTFNSQPTINAMSAKPTIPPVQTLRKPPGTLTIHNQHKAKSDPNPARPIQPNKLKINPPRPCLTRNPHEPEKTQDEQQEMEVQCDKKRRRDENSSSIATTNSQSFLTAGPGRQDCRDQ
jgi:hypothetical protein